jgi:glutamyl-tRNA reductase
MQKLLAIPIVKLKNTDPDSINFIRGIRLLNALFSRPDACDDADAEETAQTAPDARRRPPQAPAGPTGDGEATDPPSRPTMDDVPACPYDTHAADAEADTDAARIREALEGPVPSNS